MVGIDYEVGLRSMLLCIDWPETEKRTARAGRYSEVWKALVLVDSVWPVGLLVTVALDMSGFLLIEEG